MNNILVTRPSMPSYEEYCEEIKDLWSSKWLTNMGVKHKQLQSELQKYLGVAQIDLLTNGHMALELSMQALGLTGEIITTPFTFASTTHAIVRNGLKPVFCDINADDYTIDTSRIESLITEKTSAIVPVHVYGNVCNIEEIDRIADKYNLKVIYDACHAFGETYNGSGIGSFGDASCFSFHATKVFNTIEGGAVCFKNEFFGNRIYELKNFGIHGPETVTAVGANAKLNEFSAAMGICNLRHINEEIRKRKIVYERYISLLSNINGIQLPVQDKRVKYNYSYFPVLFNKDECGISRDEAFERLSDNNIMARKYFYPLISEFECYKNQYDPCDTPVAKYVSENILTLPIYADLSLSDVDRISGIIISCK